MATNVEKTIITVTVLHAAGDGPSLAPDLEHIAREISDGAWIGHVEVHPAQRLDKAAAARTLLAMGNDGEFFGEIE